MARLGFVDPDGTMFSAVHRIQQEGHEVLYWITGPDEAPENEKAREQAERAQRIGDGLVDKAKTLDDVLAFEPDVIVTYNSPQIQRQITEILTGVPTWGSTEFSVKME